MRNRGTLVVPIVMVGAGTGWTLNALGVAPGIDWMWTLGLASVGVWAFVAAGMKKFGVVVGSFLAAASTLSVMRQTGLIPPGVEVPVLVTALGCVLLVARAFPSTQWGVLLPPEPKPAVK